LINSTYINNM